MGPVPALMTHYIDWHSGYLPHLLMSACYLGGYALKVDLYLISVCPDSRVACLHLCQPLLSYSSSICRMSMLLVFNVLGQRHLQGCLAVLTMSGSDLIASADGIASCMCLIDVLRFRLVSHGCQLPLADFRWSTCCQSRHGLCPLWWYVYSR